MRLLILLFIFSLIGGVLVFENYKVFKTDFAGRPLVVETGKIAGLANGACLVRYGETVVMP